MKKEQPKDRPQAKGTGSATRARRTVKKKKSSPIRFRWVAGAILVILILVYGIGVYHYKDHFYAICM